MWEAVDRFTSGGGDDHSGHDHHEFEGGTVTLLGVLGIIVKLAVAYVLSRSSKQSLNVEGARRQAVVDVISSASLVVSGLLVVIFGEAEWVESVHRALHHPVGDFGR